MTREPTDRDSNPVREPTTSETDQAIREVYTEYLEDDRTIAVISDPDHEDAWIRSTLIDPVER